MSSLDVGLMDYSTFSFCTNFNWAPFTLYVLLILENSVLTHSYNGSYMKEPQTRDLVFNSSGFLTYTPETAGTNEVSRLQFRFKTIKNTSILLISATETDRKESMFLTLYMYKGSLHLSISSPNKLSLFSNTFRQQYDCNSVFSTCADDRWHELIITSSFNILQFQLDNRRISEPLPKALLGLRMKTFYLGGGPSLLKQPPNIDYIANFSGCVQHIFYKRGEKEVELIDLIRTKQFTHLKVNQVELQNCNVRIAKRETSVKGNYVTFTRTGSYLLVRGWKTVSEGQLAFRLRTFRRNCLLIFSSSGWSAPKATQNELRELKRKSGALAQLINVVDPIDRLTGTDLFSVELREGYLVMLLNTGSGINEFQTEDIWSGMNTSWYMADGRHHSVEIRLKDGSLKVSVDGKDRVMKPPTRPKYTFLNLNSDMYIGGLPEEMRLSAPPPQVWSARLRDDFIGCLGDLEVDGSLIDLQLEAAASWARQHVRSGCDQDERDRAVCLPSSCGSGLCTDGWTETVCDCDNTNFGGVQCREEIDVFNFNGYQGIGVRLSKLPEQSEAESLVLRFQTAQHNSLFFESTSVTSTAPDKFSLQISNGRIVLFYNLGLETKNYTTMMSVSDGQWHTLRVLRRSRRLQIKIDDEIFSHSMDDEASILDSDYICVGSLEQNPSEINKEDGTDAFIGRLSQFKFNGLDILHLIRLLPDYRLQQLNSPSLTSPSTKSTNSKNSREMNFLNVWKESFEVNADTANINNSIFEYPLQFHDGISFIEFPLSGTNECVHLSFSIKSRSATGVLCYLETSKQDFLGIELMDGQMHIIYRIDSLRGSTNIQNIPSLNDTNWHSIKLNICTRDELKISVSVNGNLQHTPNNGPISQESTFSRVYFGKLPFLIDEIKPLFWSPQGFDGCIARLKIYQPPSANVDSEKNVEPSDDIITENPLRYAKQLENVDLGCRLRPNAWEEESDLRCRPGHCGFGGRCVQQLRTYFCDCSMSGFTGPVCTDVATAIRFPSETEGCAVLEFNPLRNTTRDAIAFGLQTKYRGQVILLHITSHSNSLDFLRLELVTVMKRSNLRLTYNMGSGIQLLQDSNVDVANGDFHIIRVIRTKAHVQLQVDSEAVSEVKSKNDHGSHFNEVHQVFIGCDHATMFKLNAKSIENTTTTGQYFHGHFTGLNLNGVYLGDILLGEMVSGIFLKASKGLMIDPSFTPNIKHTSHLPANDMEAEQPYPIKMPNSKSSPLVSAKPICFEAESYRKLANCKPSNPHGIVQPKWSIPSEDSKETSELNQKQKLLNIGSADSDKSTFQGHDSLKTSMDNSHLPPIDFWEKLSHDDVPVSPSIRSEESDSNDEINDLVEVENNETSSSYGFKSFNSWMVCGGIVSLTTILLFSVIGCLVYRCRRRNEGSYNVEDSRTCINKRLPQSPQDTVKRKTRYGKLVVEASVGEAVELQLMGEGQQDEGILGSASSVPSGNVITMLKQPKSPNKEWYV